MESICESRNLLPDLGHEKLCGTNHNKWLSREVQGGGGGAVAHFACRRPQLQSWPAHPARLTPPHEIPACTKNLLHIVMKLVLHWPKPTLTHNCLHCRQISIIEMLHLRMGPVFRGLDAAVPVPKCLEVHSVLVR